NPQLQSRCRSRRLGLAEACASRTHRRQETGSPPVLKTGRITGPHALPWCQRLTVPCYLESSLLPRSGRESLRQSGPRGTLYRQVCTHSYVRLLSLSETTNKSYEGSQR